MRTALTVVQAVEVAAMAGFVLYVCALVVKDVADDITHWWHRCPRSPWRRR